MGSRAAADDATRGTGFGTLSLVTVTAIWGSTFFIIKDAVAQVDPIDFLAVRFAIAALIPALIFWRSLRGLTRRQWAIGLGLGAVYGFAQIAQTIGLAHTAASVSGFITGTYVVLTPLCVWIGFRAKLSPATWLAVVLATVGLAVLSLSGGGSFGMGEALTLLGALLYAIHIVLLGRWARSMPGMALTILQLVAVAIVCGVLGLRGGISVPATAGVWGPIFYTAIVAGVVTMGLQSFGQRHLSATRVALLFTLEPVFATLFAILFGGEHLTPRLVVGGVLILLATLLGVRGGQSESLDPEPRFARRHVHEPKTISVINADNRSTS
ncbi:DMT family transporter [Propionibacteriaceae bacterium G57]|uniref:DMT family transporter n=1 Tax=Aestuariimicrobium sp. G57 TaxID=3418485 RepID=UPI003DA78CBD